MSVLRSLENLNFDNSFARLPERFYQITEPQPLKGAHLISFNTEVAALLDLDPCQVTPEALATYFGGHEPLPGSESLAMKYTGHQFGVYNPDLGDGRGLLLGEVLNQAGERWDLHLKGAGKTAFSRFGDGRAVLRSSVREYLAGEAMQGLGIPTTRALCLIGSDDYTRREGMEPCAMLLRVSRCHIRFGHFEYFYYHRLHDELKQLADYCIERYFPHLAADENPYRSMFAEVLESTAQLVARWQAFGFVHGVLNTDNMSLLSETFDYGPYSFLDAYQPDYVSNQNDHQKRYAFKAQPGVVLWNLACLGQALLPLVERADLEAQLERFGGLYEAAELARYRERLGLSSVQDGDAELVSSLKTLMAEQRVDMTRFFRALSCLDGSDGALEAVLGLWPQPSRVTDWLLQYQARLDGDGGDGAQRRGRMLAVNPKYVLRNYMNEEAIRAAHQGDFQPVNDLMTLLRNPYAEQPEFERFAGEPPDWAGAICLTCSS
ncbi:protein adenylyltransferase SelO [Marinobacterium rhizophilum]|uniref:Protein nucleotidyltransferase YdiU n=1 Tax=Marinobacterium rhizophilum TaxID=420402 RepID=A0ABY5HPN2_9GAMM|nr:YdiU family protein [Marinobacterium rhizophilum]UTW13747.1 YdiU family protein [Marinobacterium rhizophilum]